MTSNQLPALDVSAPAQGGEMAEWRARFLGAILGFACVCGTLVAVPSVYAAARDGLWMLVIADTVAVAVIFVLWRSSHWPYSVRAWSLVALDYFLGAFLLVIVGAVGQFYLLAFPVMVALLMGLRAAVAAIVLDAVTVLVLGYGTNANVDLVGFGDAPFIKWTIITLNFAFVSAVVTLAVAILLRKLEMLLRQQRTNTHSLERQQERLRAAYGELLHETGTRQRAEEDVRQLNASLEARVQERTAELELANKELEAFAYTVSHDLRGPLRSINGFSQLLARQLEPGALGPVRHSLSRIRANTEHMEGLIDALLELARLSRAPVRWGVCDLATLARNAAASCAALAPEQRVHLIIPDTLPVKGDPELLRVVMDNLIGNAWKFTGREALAEIEVGQRRGAEGQAVYFVRDNGVGFDMAHASKLFGTFQRLHAPGDFPGTGIGLLTAQRVVARHGGRIWAQAAPGEGATFSFTLGSAVAHPVA